MIGTPAVRKEYIEMIAIVIELPHEISAERWSLHTVLVARGS